MEPENFEKIRRSHTLAEREIRFEGVPFYKLGDPYGGISEFHADRVIVLRKTKRADSI